MGPAAAAAAPEKKEPHDGSRALLVVLGVAVSLSFFLVVMDR